MKYLNKKNFFLFGFIVLVAVMLYNSFSQPGVEELETKFTQITSIRNEQNTGPILRSYVVTVDKVKVEDMKKYGNFMPHTKYGNTKVYFFPSNRAFPKSIQLVEPVFNEELKQNCILVYEKNGMGVVKMSEIKPLR